MRDQKDPLRFYIVPLFQSEEQARASEADPRRVEATASIRSLLFCVLAAPPEFTDLDVIDDWQV